MQLLVLTALIASVNASYEMLPGNCVTMDGHEADMKPYKPYYTPEKECEVTCNKLKDCTAFSGMFLDEPRKFPDGTVSKNVCFMAYRHNYRGKTEGSDVHAECWIK